MKNIIFLIGICIAYQNSFSQASLASEDFIENVPITENGEKITYSLVRDGNQKNQWYYIPSRIRLSEKQKQNGSREPEFTLIRYQFKDPKNPQELLEGGIIQF